MKLLTLAILSLALGQVQQTFLNTDHASTGYGPYSMAAEYVIRPGGEMRVADETGHDGGWGELVLESVNLAGAAWVVETYTDDGARISSTQGNSYAGTGPCVVVFFDADDDGDVDLVDFASFQRLMGGPR